MKYLLIVKQVGRTTAAYKYRQNTCRSGVFCYCGCVYEYVGMTATGTILANDFCSEEAMFFKTNPNVLRGVILRNSPALMHQASDKEYTRIIVGVAASKYD